MPPASGLRRARWSPRSRRSSGPTRSSPSSRAVNAPALILVADDDDDVRELVVFRLERAGYEVITAADGEQAVELASERRPDLCVIDVMMPKLDGYEVTRRLRETDGLS